MNALQKMMILGIIKRQFPDAESILIDVSGKTILIKRKDGTTYTEKNDGYAEYMPWLMKSKGLERLDSIYINVKEGTGLLRGDKDVII